METTKELTISYDEAKRITTSFMDPAVWTQMKGMAETFKQSGALPSGIDNVAKLMMIMQAGLELGLKPVEAINALYIVNGQVNLWGKAVTSRIKRFGFKVKYKDETAQSVTAIVAKKEETYEETYSFDQAEKSGYTKTASGQIKVGWKEGINRKLKLRYGAISVIAKTYIPEVLGSAQGIVEVEEDFIPQIPEIPNPVNKAQPTQMKESEIGLTEFIESHKRKTSATADKSQTGKTEEKNTEVSNE